MAIMKIVSDSQSKEACICSSVRPRVSGTHKATNTTPATDTAANIQNDPVHLGLGSVLLVSVFLQKFQLHEKATIT